MDNIMQDSLKTKTDKWASIFARVGTAVIGAVLIAALIKFPAAVNCQPAEQNRLTYVSIAVMVMVIGFWFFLKATFIVEALLSDDQVQQRYATSWVVASFGMSILIFAFFYKIYGIVPTDTEITPSILDYLYFSIVTFTTLGYGDFRPCPSTRIIAAAQALMAFIYYPFVIAIILKRTGNPPEKSLG